MSDKAAAIADRLDHDDPFPIVPDEGDFAAAGEAGEAGLSEHADAIAPSEEAALGPAWKLGDPPEDATEPNDPLLDAMLAPDSREFLRSLIAVAAGGLRQDAGDDMNLGLVLARLGQALADGQDEAGAFRSVVDALGRRHAGDARLTAVVPIIAAFVARLVVARRPADEAPGGLEGVRRLTEAAEAAVDGALEAGGSHAWRRLPDIAATIAERAARRGLSLGAVAEALPRLIPRFGATPREPAGRDRVISLTDHPRGGHPRGGAADEPRRMVISGPVEIVILDR